MAEASLGWAGQTASDQALSSDEEDFVSSQSTASAEPGTSTQSQLSATLGKLCLDHTQHSNQSSVMTMTRGSAPVTGASNFDASDSRPRKTRMELLDLPLDVLREIVKEVTHTNDLTSLALTCSALHNLTIPHMYSRFDIVWPESLDPSTEDYAGVDALSYGLSTLVMGDDIFHQLPPGKSRVPSQVCVHCGCDDRAHRFTENEKKAVSPGFGLRRGNYYAQYTRIFSIGNGPLSWVQEYSVNREVGKMLGTLVALAVARMVNLEAFIWDMPTGVVREIWLALASLANRPGHECRLERIWVRWHDNSEHSLRPHAPLLSSLMSTLKNAHIEHPSLSVLPPLKSVTVLDIDEPAYVDELGILIDRSRDRLVELRIGVSSKASLLDWVRCAKEADSKYPKSWPKDGGVLSILSKGDGTLSQEDMSTKPSAVQALVPSQSSTFSSSAEQPITADTDGSQETDYLSGGYAQQTLVPTTEIGSPAPAGLPKSTFKTLATPYGYQTKNDKLNLQVLELERIPLHLPTLLPTIEWTRLTTLTLMSCRDHENLWRALRRKYAPPTVPASKPKGGRRSSIEAHEYSLNIKHLRTDTVSSYLMLFIKEALAPNTLESVYLHAPHYEPLVPIDAIYKHILRRHRLSLRKVLVDASERFVSGIPSNHWQEWSFNHEMVSFVTSGRMPQLRELGMAMDHRNWHHFLQRLPNMSRLYALYLTNIGNTVQRDLKELALQVLDIVSIRPELKITYIGLQAKCYQILEGDSNDSDFDETLDAEHNSNAEEEDDEFEDGAMAPTSENNPLSPSDDSDRLSSDLSDGYDTGQDEEDISRVRFRLQEILFYDDKISIFKARHGVI